MVALSFVRSAKDIELVHSVMDEENRRVPVLAKIEKPQAVENLNEIIDAFDAFMVARGDLGVEPARRGAAGPEKNRHRCPPVGEAGDRGDQMLESMISSPRPTGPKPPTWPTQSLMARTP